MPTHQERQALAFLVALALLAAGVRVVGVRRFEAQMRRAGGNEAADGAIAARALSAQQQAVDSAVRDASPRKQRKRPAVPSRSPKVPKLVAHEVVIPPGPVNVNSATAEELERLPRVGPALANRIVAWRERHGPFRGPDDLRHVRGIGPSTVRVLDSLVTFARGHSP